MDAKFVIFLFALAFATADEAVRIVGGRDAVTGQFPYMASFRLGDDHICGGAIISGRHILTAAHCIISVISSNIDRINVVTGTNSLTSGGIRYRVAAVFYHKSFPNDAERDVGIVRLVNSIAFNDVQKLIQLADYRPPPEQYAAISGWGSVTPYPNQLSNWLQYQYVRTMKYSDCRRIFPDVNIAICTKNEEYFGLACSGDGGSPLVYENRVVGVASRTGSCLNGWHPDRYVSVADNIQFIREAMTW